MNTVGFAFAAALFFAVIIERITEAAIDPFIPPQSKRLTLLPTMAMGLVGCFAFGLDIITPVLQPLGYDPSTAWAGMAFTGILIGGGSNLVHDVWGVVAQKKE